MIITDPSLKPSDRYFLILLDKLVKDGFVLKQRKFVRDFQYGKEVIDLSFISTMGFIHGVEFYYKIIFDDAESTFKKLFGKHWSNWTVHEQVGNIFNYLYDEAMEKYTDRSLNQATEPFWSDVYPKIGILSERFKTYEQLNNGYNSFPSKSIDIVPSQRFERRILMGLLLTKCFEPDKYEIRKIEYLESFENFDPFQREQQRKDIEDGVRVLDNIDMNTTNMRFVVTDK